jgi:hypothetical protein
MREYEDKQWNTQYEKLVALKRKNGHCLVPAKYEEDMSLGVWVGTQRVAHTKKKLRLDRKGLLDEIGFVWRVDKQWNKQYEKLVEFKQKNGNCMVPRVYKEEASFGYWVANQRAAHANKKMRLDRKGLLDEIGFVWRVVKSAPAPRSDKDQQWNKQHDKQWNKQYEKLVEFQGKNGHCRVSATYEEDMSLGNWVRYQQRLHVNNKLRLERKGLLDEIGFVWKARTLAAPSSTTDVSCRLWFLSPFIQVFFLTLVVFLLLTCSNETLEEAESGQGHVRHPFEYPSPNVKQPRTCLAESGQKMAAATNPRDGAIGSRSSVEKDGAARDEEDDSKPSMVTSSSAILDSYPDQEAEVVQQEAYKIPSGWKRVKLEPDC